MGKLKVTRKMQELARDVRQLSDQLAVCTRCGMCQAHCPLFAQTRQEADVSRGKLSLINGLIDQMFDDARGVNERLERCLLCGSCAHGCPSNVNTVEIFLKARVIITRYLGLSLPKKILFKKILAHPQTFNTLIGMVRPFQKLFFKKEDNFQATSCARIISPVSRHRHIIPFKESFLNTIPEHQDFRINGKGVKVAFFAGCLIDKALPNIARSVVDVLRHFHARVFIPSLQGCCGIPAIAAGDMDTFENLVTTNVDLFFREKFDYLVTACATCSSTIIKLWPSLLKHTDKYSQGRIQALAEKTVDISWLMEKRFALSYAIQDDENKKEMITYHDPCHLKKSLGVYHEPRQVIRAAGHELREMKNPDTCCGMGGSFNLHHYEISSKIGREKARNIIDTGCSIVATSCPACIMQISDMLAKEQQPVSVLHPVEIYAEALNRHSKS